MAITDVTPTSRLESDMKPIRYAIAGLGLLFAVVLLPAPPASATIHEIVAAWCSGHGELEPPGIQGGKNFAQPVNSNGFVGPTVPFTGSAGPGLLITFNYGVSPAKVVGTGVFVVVGQSPAGPLYIELVTPDSSFPAFRNCPRFTTG
ncbi:MAG: hypothetical protein ACJ72B_18845 [Ornithinibacter sp.]